MGGMAMPGMQGNQYGMTAGLPQSYTMFNQLMGSGGQANAQDASSYIPGVNVPAGGTGQAAATGAAGGVPTNYAVGPGGVDFEDPTSPVLQQTWENWLQGQVGQGVAPFNLSTNLATGGTTQPGQLNAPLNATLQQLMQYFQTGQTGGNTSLGALNQLAGGTSAIPQWQTDLAAMQQNIQQNQANLKEQFASTGSLAGSEYGQAMQNYMQGTSATQNALLAQIQQQNQQTQLQAASQLQNVQSQLGQYLQGLDQQDIQNMLTEFMQTQPQYNPVLQYLYGQSNAYAPIFKQGQGPGVLSEIAGGTGLASAAAGGISAGMGASAGGASTGASVLAGLAAL